MARDKRAGASAAAVSDGHGARAVLPHLLLHAAGVPHAEECSVLPQC